MNLTKVNSLVVFHRLSQAISTFALNILAKRFGFTKGIYVCCMFVLIGWIICFYMQSFMGFVILMIVGGFQVGIQNNFTTQIIGQILPNDVFIGIAIYQAGLTGSQIIISKISQMIINPESIPPSIVHQILGVDITLYPSSVYDNLTHFMWFFIISWFQVLMAYKNIMPDIRIKETNDSMIDRSIEAKIEKIKVSLKFNALWIVQFLMASITGFYVLNIKKLGLEYYKERDLGLFGMIAGVSLCLGSFFSGMLVKKIGITLSFIINISCIGIGSLIFTLAYHNGIIIFCILVIIIYTNTGLCCYNFSSCCISLYGIKIGQKLQPIFLLNWLGIGIGNLTMDMYIYRDYGLVAFGWFSFITSCLSLMVIIYVQIIKPEQKKIRAIHSHAKKSNWLIIFIDRCTRVTSSDGK